MFGFEKKINICTHDGNFHADDVFACAVVVMWAKKKGKKIKITRTRDKNLIDRAHIVIDVGGIYNEKLNRFDHHQNDFNLKRENKIPYASFGLVWKKYAKSICDNNEILNMIEKKLVLPIDAFDNGFSITKNIYDDIYEYNLVRDMVRLFRNTWDEGNKNTDKRFYEFLLIAVKILEREIELGESLIKGEKEVLKSIENQGEPEILILDKYLPWERIVSDFRNIFIVVYPDSIGNGWCVEAVKSNLADFESDRVYFPPSWGGKINDELVKESGVVDALFCHRGLFFAVAKTKEGALGLAKKSIKRV